MCSSDLRLRSLAREQTEQALNVTIGIMNSKSVTDRDRLTAAFGILDRGWGKPTQPVAPELPAQIVARKLTYEIVRVNETQEQPEPSQISGEARRTDALAAVLDHHTQGAGRADVGCKSGDVA